MWSRPGGPGSSDACSTRIRARCSSCSNRAASSSPSRPTWEDDQTIPGAGHGTHVSGSLVGNGVRSGADPANNGPEDNLQLVGDEQNLAKLDPALFNHYSHASNRGYKLGSRG